MPGSPTQAGFFYQNNIAALKILEMLGLGSRISHIVLENPEHAEHIDDVIVHYADRVEYTQVKWAADDDANFTLYGILTPESEKRPALLKQLAAGFASIEKTAGARIILCSTKGASAQGRPSEGLPHSLRDVIRDVVEESHVLPVNAPLEALPAYETYQDTLRQMEMATGLPHDAFQLFVRCLTFELNQPSIAGIRDQIHTRLIELGIGREGYDPLLTGTVEWSISGTPVTRAIVERRLGVRDRFVDGLAHVFPVEKEQYVRNTQLFRDLDESIERLPGGFILLEGPPGSGKSTALTMYRSQRDDIILGYYCFIPDEMSLGSRRLERSTFLKSVCVGIQQAFPQVEFPEQYSADYAAKLTHWLHVLSEMGKKVILLVDGLDHVYREREHLTSPLTDALAGSHLPENVFFLLSSQNIDALPASLRREVSADRLRHRVMPHFSEAQIQEFVRKRGIHLDRDEMAAIAGKSEGNPLYLHYICELLTSAAPRLRTSMMRGLPALSGGSIDAYHEMLYDDISRETLAVWVLAILAHRQEYTSTDTLKEVLNAIGKTSDIVEIERQMAPLRHLLKTSDGRAYGLFHNSFREFVLRKSENLSAALNEGMLDYYREHANSDEAFRHRYRHLLGLQRYNEILADCSPAWLRRNWEAFRPIGEMTYNLNLAWQAAVEKEDFVEFVRVALLQQEWGVIRRNLENSDRDMATVLLHCGHTGEAVRRIWDGVRVCCSLSDFCSFALAYRRQTGNVLPSRMADAAFDLLQRPTSEEGLTHYYQARSLYESWQEVFAEIGQLHWSTKAEHEHTMEPADQVEGAAINERIMIGVVQTLADTGAYPHLHEMIATHSVPPHVRANGAARLANMMLSSGPSPDVDSICANVDFTLLSEAERARLVVCFAEHGRLALLGRLGESIVPPQFFRPLTKSGVDFGLRIELFDLYDRLRASFLHDNSGYRVCSLEIDGYDMPEKAVFRALVELADLWRATILTPPDPSARVRRLKAVFDLLNVPVSAKCVSAHKTENDPYYISRGVHRLYAHVFEYLRDHIPAPDIPEVVCYWLEVDRRDGGYKSGHTSISAARVLHDRHGEAVRDSVRHLLERAEEQARQDEETTVLVSELLACLDAYGRCGMPTDALRLWKDVFTCACGVYSRKDYQFNEAIDALTVAHSVCPEKTLGRISALLTRAHRLENAAGGRTSAIAIEALIGLAAKMSPELGLRLLSQEDDGIYRERAMRRVISDALMSGAIPLPYAWAITRTMSKWRDYTQYDEETFPTTRDVFQKALERGETALAREIYDWCLHLFMVEKGKPANVSAFLSICRSNAVDWPSEYRAAAEAARSGGSPEDDQPNKQPFDPFPGITVPNYEELHRISEGDFDKFLSVLDPIRVQCRVAERGRETSHLYQTARKMWRGFAKSAGAAPQCPRAQLRAGVHRFRQFEHDVAVLDVHSEGGYARRIAKLLDDLVTDIGGLVATAGWRTYVESHVDVATVASDLARKTWHCDYWYQQKVLAPHISRLVGASSLYLLSRWELFCKSQMSGHELTEILFLIALRQKGIAPAETVRLLQEAWASNAAFFYMAGKERFHAFFDLLFELDPAKARRLLLSSFAESYERYSAELIYRLDYLTRYAPQFTGSTVLDDLYELHDRYNARLVEGLASSNIDYGWVAGFKASISAEVSAVRYLVDLFDYPQVEIRKLALEALNWLIGRDPNALLDVLVHCDSGSANSRQHAVVLLYQHALSQPARIAGFKARLLRWTQAPHFNLRQAVKELMLAAHKQHSFLAEAEFQQVCSINTHPMIVLPQVVTPAPPTARNFVPSSHLVSLLRELDAASDTRDLGDYFYDRIRAKGWTAERGHEAEGAVHRRHNINTNFDTIEVNGPYYMAADDSLNELVVDEIQKQSIDDRGIQRLAHSFRLYDPFSLSRRLTGRPSGVDWVADGSTNEDFLAFRDVPALQGNLEQGSTEWIWLYQDGHQRAVGDGMRGVSRTTYFRLVAFSANHDLWEDSDTLSKALTRKPYANVRNRYRTEMLSAFADARPFGIAGVTPLIGVSLNRFRGQNELSLAVLLPGIIEALGLSRESEMGLNFVCNGTRVVEFLEWMEPYDQDRRVQKPIGAGVALRIRRTVLDRWLTLAGAQLAYYVELHRSTDKYVPEAEMKWQRLEVVLSRNAAAKTHTCHFDGDTSGSGYPPAEAFF